MTWPSTVIQYLSLVQIGSYLLLLRKLFKTGLARKYKYFACYLGFECLRIPIMSAIPLRTNTYAHAYFATQPIVWLLYVLMVFELFQLVLKGHIGIATLSRKALSWALAASGIVSVLTLVLDLQRRTTDSAILFNFMLLERLIMTSLLVLVLCLIVFLSYFPVPLSRNGRVHACIFATFFAVRTALLFIRTWFGLETAAVLNVVAYSLMIGCLIGWIWLLTPEGEAVSQREKPATDSEARLLAQLDALNQTLLRSARK